MFDDDDGELFPLPQLTLRERYYSARLKLGRWWTDAAKHEAGVFYRRWAYRTGLSRRLLLIRQWWSNDTRWISRRKHNAEMRALQDRLDAAHKTDTERAYRVVDELVRKGVTVRPQLHPGQPALRVLTTIDCDLFSAPMQSQYRDDYLRMMADRIARHVENELRTIDVGRAVAYAREEENSSRRPPQWQYPSFK